MKNIKLLFIFPLFLIFSCDQNRNQNSEQQNERNYKSKRINIIERVATSESYYSLFYEIIEIDGKEYLTNSNGGIIRLDSCKCN